MFFQDKLEVLAPSLPLTVNQRVESREMVMAGVPLFNEDTTNAVLQGKQLRDQSL